LAGSKKLRRRAKLSESFFPLGSWRQTTPAAWDGFARLARNGAGVIVLFRNKSGAANAKVQLPVIPDGKFRLRSLITNKDVGTYDRTLWMRGVAIDFSGPVGVLEIEPVANA